MRSALFDELETLLGGGLMADAERAGLAESTARLLLALPTDGGVPMGELSRRIGRDPSTTTRFVDRAAAEGLVARQAGEDRRSRIARLTPEGTAARDRLVALRQERAGALPDEVAARTGLGPEEVEWFLEALVRSLRRS